MLSSYVEKNLIDATIFLKLCHVHLSYGSKIIIERNIQGFQIL